MHYAKVVGIFQTLHPGRTTISVLQGLGYFFSPLCFFQMCYFAEMERWLRLTQRREGRAGSGWGGQGISAWPCVSTERSEVVTHRLEEQHSDPTCIFGCRKNLWGWRGAKIRAGSGDVSHGQPVPRQQPGWEAGGASGMVAPGNTLGFGPTLGIPQAGKSLAKHELFQQIMVLQQAPATGSLLLSTTPWDVPPQSLWAEAGEGGGTQSHPVLCHWELRGREEAHVEMKLNRAWSEGSLILAQAQSKGIYF